MARGSIPADVVFVGEAPGESEDVLGSPFVGPAGKLLDNIIGEAGGNDFRLAWFNLVGCIPKDENTHRKKVEPLPEEIKACQPRIVRFLGIANPKLVVAVGELAKKEMLKTLGWGRGLSPEQNATIIHPAALLRLESSQQGLMVQRCIIQLADAFEGVRR